MGSFAASPRRVSSTVVSSIPSSTTPRLVSGSTRPGVSTRPLPSTTRHPAGTAPSAPGCTCVTFPFSTSTEAGACHVPRESTATPWNAVHAPSFTSNGRAHPSSFVGSQRASSPTSFSAGDTAGRATSFAEPPARSPSSKSLASTTPLSAS
jgi:hypothetical protein